MEKKTTRALDDELRKSYLEKLKTFLEAEGEEVLYVSNSEIAFPVVDSAGNDKWVCIPVKVPAKSRLDGEEYDGYAAAEDYQMKQVQKAEKKAEADRKKAEKAKKDAAAREAKAAAKEKAKAEREEREKST